MQCHMAFQVRWEMASDLPKPIFLQVFWGFGSCDAKSCDAKSPAIAIAGSGARRLVASPQLLNSVLSTRLGQYNGDSSLQCLSM